MRTAPLLDPPVSRGPAANSASRKSAAVSPSEPLTVWLIDEPECEAYEQFVAACPNAGLYHTLAWRDAARLGDGGTPSYLAAMRGERVAGVLPLVEQCDLWGRRRLVSLPDTPACGPAAEDADIEAALTHKAAEYARSRGAAALVMRRFAPPGQRRGQVTAGGWLRVPARVLIATAREIGGSAIASAADRTADSSDGTAAAACVKVLARRGIQAGVAYGDVNGGSVAWARFGATLHVLSPVGGPAAFAVIAAILRQVGASGPPVRWIDLPPMRGVGPAMRELARQSQCVVEERIPVPRERTLLGRAARSISMALSG